MVPTALHPNERLDGALVSGNDKTGSKTPTLSTCRLLPGVYNSRPDPGDSVRQMFRQALGLLTKATTANLHIE